MNTIKAGEVRRVLIHPWLFNEMLNTCMKHHIKCSTMKVEKDGYSILLPFNRYTKKYFVYLMD